MRIKLLIFLLVLTVLTGCKHSLQLSRNDTGNSGSEFYRQAATMGWKERDSMALAWVGQGRVPRFLLQLEPVETTVFDSISGKAIKITFYVTPDYFSVGLNEDWARVCLTPMASQKIAAQLHCVLPSRKMVDAIYQAARWKLEPVPLFAFRDSTPTMWHHHLVIEGQRKGRSGLIAGIKKDIVFSPQLLEEKKKDRVAIYGWHKTDGRPIQPLYLGHVNWYVDYSHGLRLVWRKIRVDGRWGDIETLRNENRFAGLLSN
jgi:hypothetical protein